MNMKQLHTGSQFLFSVKSVWFQGYILINDSHDCI